MTYEKLWLIENLWSYRCHIETSSFRLKNKLSCLENIVEMILYLEYIFVTKIWFDHIIFHNNSI